MHCWVTINTNLLGDWLWKHHSLMWPSPCRHWWRWLRWRRICMWCGWNLMWLATLADCVTLTLIARRTPWKHPSLIWLFDCLVYCFGSWLLVVRSTVLECHVQYVTLITTFVGDKWRTPWKNLSLIWPLYCRPWLRCHRWRRICLNFPITCYCHGMLACNFGGWKMEIFVALWFGYTAVVAITWAMGYAFF